MIRSESAVYRMNLEVALWKERVMKGDMKTAKTIRGLFSQAGFVAESKLVGVMSDRYARVIRLKRRKKQACVLNAERGARGGTTSTFIGRAIFRRPIGGFTLSLSVGEFGVRGAAPCL